MTLIWPCHVWGQKYPSSYLTCLQGTDFVTAQFREKCTERPQMTLMYSRVKGTPSTYTPLRLKFFVNFPLRWAILLSYGECLRKAHLMTPNNLAILKVETTHMHTSHTLKAQIFSSLLYKPVSSYSQNLRKHIQDKKYPYILTCILSPKFSCFTLRWAVFK